jgi:hypothetical protein
MQIEEPGVERDFCEFGYLVLRPASDADGVGGNS